MVVKLGTALKTTFILNKQQEDSSTKTRSFYFSISKRRCLKENDVVKTRGVTVPSSGW